MKKNDLADIEFTLEWKSSFATHTDVYYVQNVDPVNDKFPLDLGEKIAKLKTGGNYSQTFPAKDLLQESFSTDKVTHFKTDLFDTHFKGQNSPPMLYRFYPSAIVWEGLESLQTDYTPFRLISSNDENMVADRNHPLAKYYISLTARKVREYKTSNDHDIPKKHIGKLITSKGPGMQAPFEYGDSVFFDKYPFDLNIIDKNDNYLKQQLDLNTTKEISQLYSEHLSKHSKVLDLMSCGSSYLAEDYKTGMLTGIGPNETTLSKNQRLDTYQVQDLNSDSILPFETNSFDDAICTCSIENLTDPLKVIQEVARVVSPGGKFIITFSGNKPAANSINLWQQLHPFERIQLVLEYFRHTGLFKELNTFSKRGILQSKGIKKSKQDPLSNPVYAVWGIVE
ncbi:MAG: ubiquinone/menaquinone biosynthesis C-methylase UbiE [Cocleimonas sp.]|jgi:ubiquinone/menaquinone biosynthesis C-methylase UbiE